MATEQMELPGIKTMHRSGKCLRCNRALKDPKSMERGYGPVCAAKMAAKLAGEKNMSEFADRHIDEPIENGIVLERTADNNVATNVPHIVAHHSPTGFEWGYAGSGPADLALNIVEVILRRLDFKGELSEPMWDGYRVFKQAYRLHQDFKFAFIATAPREVGTFIMDYQTAKEWVLERLEKEVSE